MRPLLLLAAGVAACAPAWPPQAGRFAPLVARDLVTFEQGLATEREQGSATPWTEVGWAWVDLLRCRDVPPAPAALADDPQARLVYELVRLDQLRYRYLAARGRATETPLAGWLGGLVSAPGELDNEWLRWPADDEAWSDEIVAPAELASACPAGEAPAADAILTAVDELWRLAADDGVEAGGALARALWRAALFAAELAPRGELQSLSLSRLRSWQRQHATDLPASQTWLVDWLEVARLDPPPERALALVAELEPAPVPPALRPGILLARLRAQVRRGDLAAVVAEPPALPAPGAPLREAIAYYHAFALAARGELTPLMGLAKQILQQPGGGAPFRAELLRATMATLAKHRFSEEIVELVEELGPRGETLDRLEVLAHLYLRRRDGREAEALASWLVANQRDARAHPRYAAIRALAAVHRRDLTAFRRHLRAITARPEQLMEALPRPRRAAFFADADRELAAVLRRVLPLSAELDDEPWRQRLLQTSVDEVQHFLRGTRESQLRQDLLELYRVASEQLAESPRGYAGRLGVERRTMVLGAADLPVPFEPPHLDLGFRAVGLGFVGLIPRDGAPVASWTNTWPEQEGDGA